MNDDSQDTGEMTKIKNYQMIKSISGLILDMFTKPLSQQNLSLLQEFKYEMINKKNNTTLESENNELMELIFQRLHFFLVESVHTQTSSVIRELIRDIYGIKYYCHDYYLIDSVFQFKDYPKLFTNQIYTEARLADLINKPEEKQIKETGALFTTYQSQYPYNKELSYAAFEAMTVGNGRIKMHEGFFLLFSEYYSLYEKSNKILFSEDDHIPITWKYYLAIMAVSTIRCEYLLRELEMQFLLKGGDERWLMNGLIEVPEKLKKLARINNILAHQPWKLKVQDLVDIHSKYDSKGWHINELIHAVLILTNYHRLAAVVESTRISIRNYKPEEDQSKSLYEDQKDHKILKYVTDENVKKCIISELENFNKNENVNQTPTHKRHPSEEILKLNTSFENVLSNNSKEFSKHISSYCTVYLDFDSHSEEYNSYIEYNWQDHGIYILKNYYNDGVDSVNAEIEYLINISSNNIGGDFKKIDTTIYRHTICTYVDKIFGYQNESFDYSKTNKLLHRNHKQFIKNIDCSPQKITKTDIGVLKVTFSPEEIIHIILLVSAAKMRLQLTYFSKHLYDIIKSVE